MRLDHGGGCFSKKQLPELPTQGIVVVRTDLESFYERVQRQSAFKLHRGSHDGPLAERLSTPAQFLEKSSLAYTGLALDPNNAQPLFWRAIKYLG